MPTDARAWQNTQGEKRRISDAAFRTLAEEHGDVSAFVESLARAHIRDLPNALAPLPERIDLEALIQRQRIGPIEDFRTLAADFYPPRRDHRRLSRSDRESRSS